LPPASCQGLSQRNRLVVPAPKQRTGSHPRLTRSASMRTA